MQYLMSSLGLIRKARLPSYELELDSLMHTRDQNWTIFLPRDVASDALRLGHYAAKLFYGLFKLELSSRFCYIENLCS